MVARPITMSRGKISSKLRNTKVPLANFKPQSDEDMGLMRMLEVITSGFVSYKEAIPRGYIIKPDFVKRICAFIFDQANKLKDYKLADWPSIHVNYRFVVCVIS